MPAVGTSTVSLQEKIDFLKRPEVYPEPTTAVEVIETHSSLIFLTDYLVYKLKKPVKFDYLDFMELASREIFCKEEVKLNVRLAPSIYLEAVAMCYTPSTGLHLDQKGTPVEWLVKMKRLPDSRMLDQQIISGRLSEQEVEQVADVLARFYTNAGPVALSWSEQKATFTKEIRNYETILLYPEFTLPAPLIRHTAQNLLILLDREEALFKDRVEKQKLTEGHGDLRPEHVCLLDPPVIFDCVEFSKRLRLLDPAEELSFLAMECELLESVWVGEVLFRRYQAVSGDTIHSRLILFYKTKRALLRAALSVRHLLESRYREDGKWMNKALRYLHLAEKYMFII